MIFSSIQLAHACVSYYDFGWCSAQFFGTENMNLIAWWFSWGDCCLTGWRMGTKQTIHPARACSGCSCWSWPAARGGALALFGGTEKVGELLALACRISVSWKVACQGLIQGRWKVPEQVSERVRSGTVAKVWGACSARSRDEHVRPEAVMRVGCSRQCQSNVKVQLEVESCIVAEQCDLRENVY